MDLQPPAQVFSTTLYDRYQPQQQLSFTFIPARSLVHPDLLNLSVVKNLLEPNAEFFAEIPPSYLPAALASMLQHAAAQSQANPFAVFSPLPEDGKIWVHPNSVGFAEYAAFSENVPFEESPLKSKSAMSIAVSAGANIGLIAGIGYPPLMFLTVPAGIILCTAAAAFGPALGEKVSRLIGA